MIDEGPGKEGAGGGNRASIELLETLAEHRDAIFEISSQTWEEQDYIPVIWDEWAAEGGFYTILRGKRIIGCIKATDHAAGQVTLEGLRIHPACRGHGFAGDAFAGLIRLVESRRPPPVVMRFATADVNEISHHLGEKHGFSRVASFYHRFMIAGGEGRDEGNAGKTPGGRTCGSAARRPLPVGACENPDGDMGMSAGEEEIDQDAFNTESSNTESSNAELFNAKPGEADEIFAFIERSREWAPSKGLFPFGWVFYSLTPQVVREEIERGAVEGVSLAARDGSTGEMVGILLAHRSERHPENLEITWLSGNDHEVMRGMIREFVDRAQKTNVVEMRAKTPSPQTAGFLEQCGFSRHENFDSTVVFEKIL